MPRPLLLPNHKNLKARSDFRSLPDKALAQAIFSFERLAL